MTTVTLRPNATIVAASALTGGATTHAVTSDDSDASYATQPLSVTFDVDLGTTALPAGAVVRSRTVRIRAKSATPGATVLVNALSTGGVLYGQAGVTISTSFATYAGTVHSSAMSQAAVDALHLVVHPTFGTNVDVAELYVDLTVALVPVANVTSPTGAPTITTTDRPTFTWTHTAGSDGGPQTFYEVKVYTAAQYGAGGFDPDTSTTTYTSGITVGSVTSHQSGPLLSAVYRVYVRTAQTINGAAHWSVWDFEAFTMSVTPPTVEDVTPTPFGDARILVAVDRVVAGEAWNYLEVQRSIDAGATWEYVRGGEYVVPTVTTAFSTGDASNFDINDWEVPNGTMVLYRARATRILVAPNTVTSAWVQSSPATAWTSGEVWLKAPDDPTLNRPVQFSAVPGAGFARRQGAIAVLNRPNPVVISDVLSGGAGTLTFQTADDAEMRDLFALLRKPVLLLHPTPGWAIGAQYIAPGDVQQDPLSPRVVLPIRRFDVAYHQVDAPADSLAGSP